MKHETSGPIGEDEVMTPLRGVAETDLRGDGMIVMRGGDYLDLDLTFTDGDNTYAQFQISNVIGTLRKSDSGTVEPPLTDLEEKKVKVSSLILEILREEVRTGGKYGDY